MPTPLAGSPKLQLFDLSSTARTLSGFFLILAVIALGHDLYLWQIRPDHPFAFAALGWITKTYIPEQHQILVDLIGAEAFNLILTPLLKIPAFFSAVGLSALTVMIDYTNRRMKAAGEYKRRAPDNRFKRSK